MRPSASACWRRGHRVIAIDNLNIYYDLAIKRARLAEVEAVEQVMAQKAASGRWRLESIALQDAGALIALFAAE